jgi:hypothetical protein
MFKPDEQERLKRSGGDRVLMIIFASVLWSVLATMKLLPFAEAVLVGWTVTILIGYWLPPRPTIGFMRWASERIIMLLVFYLLVLKTPILFAGRFNVFAAFSVGALLFVSAYYAWTHHPKSTLRIGRM